MDLFKKSFRLLNTQEIEFTEEQMIEMRIRKIFNGACDKELLNFEYFIKYFNECVKTGEYGLMDFSESENGLQLFSVLVFYDEWSRNIFAMIQWERFEGHLEVASINN